MRRILILYATREGQTAKIANRIADHLAEAGAAVTCVDAADGERTARLRLQDHDLLVFGGSLHAGGVERELTDFIARHRDGITGRPRAFFLVLLSAAAKDPALRSAWLDDARSSLQRQLAVTFEEPEMIAGALAYTRYPAPLRWLMRRIARRAGGDTDTSRDHEYTDWEQVRRFARRLLEA